VGDVNGREFSGAVEAGQLHPVTLVGLDLVPGLLGDERGRDDLTGVAELGQPPVENETGGPGFVGNSQFNRPRPPGTRSATNLDQRLFPAGLGLPLPPSGQQALEAGQVVGDLSVVAGLLASFRSHSDGNRVLVDIESHV
jgi:hypothetical protein